MAQDIEKIIKLLNEMQKTNAENADSFDRILTSIGSRLDMTDANANTELLKTYISELAKSVDDKYSKTQNKFEDIEKALKAVYDSQNDHVKNADMKELFDIFSKNVNNFYTEARQEKSILTGIESKISDLASNKTDKQDILRTISLLRTDLENINISYKNTIEDVNTTLKSILTSIKNIDPLKNSETTKTQIDIMFKSVNDIISRLHDIDNEYISLEKILNNVVTNDELKVTQRIIESIEDKTEEIEKKLDDGVQKKDLDELQQALAYINKRADWNVTKQDFSIVQEQTENILNNAAEIKQTLSKVVQDIEKCPDAGELESNLKKLYTLVSSLSENINASNVKGDMFDISSKLNKLKDELSIAKTIISDLKDALSAKVLSAIDSLALTANDLKQVVSDMLERVPLKQEIEKILDNTDKISEKIESLPEKIKISQSEIDKELSSIYDKTNSIENWLIGSNIKENSDKIASQIENTSTSDEVAQVQNQTNEIISVLERLSRSYDVEQIIRNLSQLDIKINNITSILNKDISNSENREISEKLSDLERSISEIVSRAEFNDFIEELKFYITKLNSNTGSCTQNVEEMQRLQKKIEDKLQELDFSNVMDKLEGKFELLHKEIGVLLPKIESVTEENEVVKSELEQIKSLIETNLEDSNNAKNTDIEDIKEYLSEVKDYIRENSQSDFYARIQNIEDSIVNNTTYNESAYNQIIEKISGLGNSETTDEALSQAINEISSLKTQIENLEKTFKEKTDDSIDNPEDFFISKTEEFLSEKLGEISGNLSQLITHSDDNISQKFNSQSELLEQKVALLQDLLTDINSEKKISNPDFEQKLSDTNDTLEDFKQELQLVATDITEGLAKKTSQIIDELEPIKEILKKISKNSNVDNLKSEVSNLNNEMMNSTELYDISVDLADLYDKLNKKFEQNESNLKDFIISDTDSVLIKLDNLKDYIESRLNSYTPADSDSLEDFSKFTSDLEEFKQTQQELLSKSMEEILQEIRTQSDEIKSMLAVSDNSTEILEAIEELKRTFKSCAISSISTDDISDDEPKVEYSYNAASIEDLKSDFNKYSEEIKKLADDNSKITDVLQNIQSQLDKMSNSGSTNSKPQPTISEGSEIDDDDFDFLDADEDEVFNDKFNFIEAFEVLQEDIRDLKAAVDEINGPEEGRDKIPTLAGNSVLANINGKVDDIYKALSTQWLANINDYIQVNTGKLSTKLDAINTKLDVFVSDTTNTDLLNDANETLNTINDSMSDLSNNIKPEFESIKKSVSDLSNNIVPELDSIKDSVTDLSDNIVPELEALNDSDKKISSMLEELNDNITKISESSGAEELNNIKNLIQEQKDYVEELEPNAKLEAFKKCLDEINFEVNALATDTNSDNEKLHKTIKEMKESLMGAVVTIFDQVSFAEESEDIKDFVEERTEQINKNIAQITKQLQQLSSSGESEDYSYSMQDIETDLAKLRLALKEIQDNGIEGSSSFAKALTQSEMEELKTGISKLKEQTEFLIATSDKSYNALNNGIEGFGNIINQSLATKVENLSKMLESCAESDRVIKQALGYMGEWIDSTSESINKISSNSDQITRINEVISALDDLKRSINTQINEAIEDKFDLWNAQLKDLEKQFTKVEKLELQFSQHQERIDRMEMNIDKLISIVENLESPGVTRKIDKIDRQISKLSTNIEKLAAYVD